MKQQKTNRTMYNSNQSNETTDNKPKHEQPKADNNTILLLRARTHASPNARPHTHPHIIDNKNK